MGEQPEAGQGAYANPAGDCMITQEHTVPIRRSIFRVFLFLGGAINTVFFSVWFVSDIVWVDFLHTNLGRSHSNALKMLALTPFDGVFLTLALFTLPLLIGALGAKFGSLRSGKVPLWVLVVLHPLCGFAFMVQHGMLDELNLDSGFRVSVGQIPVLVGCWLWTRRRVHR